MSAVCAQVEKETGVIKELRSKYERKQRKKDKETKQKQMKEEKKKRAELKKKKELESYSGCFDDDSMVANDAYCGMDADEYEDDFM